MLYIGFLAEELAEFLLGEVIAFVAHIDVTGSVKGLGVVDRAFATRGCEETVQLLLAAPVVGQTVLGLSTEVEGVGGDGGRGVDADGAVE